MSLWPSLTLLISVTVLAGLVSLVLLFRIRSLVLILPVWVIYYWTFFGGFGLIDARLKGSDIAVEKYLGSVPLDPDFFAALVHYSVFFMAFLLVALLFACFHKRSGDSFPSNRIFFIKPGFFYPVAGFLAIVFFTAILRNLIYATSENISVYHAMSFENQAGRWWSLCLFSGETGLVISLFFLFLTMLKTRGIPRVHFWFGAVFACFFIAMFLLVGRRISLLRGILFASMLYAELFGLRALFSWKRIAVAIVAVYGLLLVASFRYFSILDLSAWRAPSISYTLISSLNSTERYASHISMYNVLKYDVPLTRGGSINRLLSSLIPSVFGLPRSESVYSYYLRMTRVDPVLGFTINHATAWYLNYGLAGLLAGGIFWAGVLCFFYDAYIKSGNILVLFFLLLFSSASVEFVRGAGPETWKSAFLLSTSIPVLIAAFFVRYPRRFYL